MNTVAHQDAGILSLLHHKIKVNESVEDLASKYKSAKPFPHVVLDQLFEDSLLDRLIAETPSLGAAKWVHNDDAHLNKFNLRSAVELGETGYQLVSFLHSAAFLYFLSEITGVWELLPDPYLQGGGYHILPRGGKFDVHADRNTAYETGLLRRLSLITYLNKSWKHEYGGQLELWNADGTRCETVIEPLFNRTIIFEIGDQNFHGVPAQVACPSGRSRNSFVAYYHTAHAYGRGEVVPHSSVYSPMFYQNDSPQESSSTVIRVARAVCPPIVVRGVKKVLGRK
jgi:hypothetical protein